MLDASVLPLANDRVRLRRLRADDAASFAEGTDDSAVRAYGHLPQPEYTVESVVTMIEEEAEPGLRRGDLAVLAIAEPSTDDFAGSMVLFGVTEDGAEVGFWMHPDHRAGGRATGALGLAVEFARRSGLSGLTARTAVENAASQRVLTLAGFTETGRATDTAPSGHEVQVLRYHRDTANPPAR